MILSFLNILEWNNNYLVSICYSYLFVSRFRNAPSIFSNKDWVKKSLPSLQDLIKRLGTILIDMADERNIVNMWSASLWQVLHLPHMNGLKFFKLEEFPPTPVCRYNLVSKRCFMCFLIATSQRLFKQW